MSELVSFSIDIIEIHLPCEQKLTSMLLIPGILRIGQRAKNVANSFVAAAEKELVEHGRYLELMRYLTVNNVHKEIITISIKAKKFHPDLDLSFAYFYCTTFQGHFLSFVPVLGIESFGKTFEIMQENLRENIELEFARKKRFQNVKYLIETQWYNDIELKKCQVDVGFYTLFELENIQLRKKKRILPEVASEMFFGSQICFGRLQEWEMLKRALLGRYKRSILIVGSGGSGKTALVEELARQKHLFGIKNTIWETNAAHMIQKLTNENGWQENLHVICCELRDQQDLLFVHNLSELFEVGQYVGNSISMGEYLKEYLQRREIQIIAECSEEELASIEMRVPGYSSLFTVIELSSLTEKELKEVIIAKVLSLAGRRRIHIAEEAIDEVIRLQKRYTPYSGFPGKPIRFLESVMLSVTEKDAQISREQILDAFYEETGMPAFLIDAQKPLPLEKMRAFFYKNIYGQSTAINTVIDLLSMVKTSLTRGNKPIASLLFIGPTGVGKTEMTKVLAEFVFSNRNRISRFDMSEFSDTYSVMRLTGEFSSQEGLLTSVVRKNPFSVILFDELEKAHYSFYDLLLQILGEGRLTDSKGNVADFCSTIIIMTSNIGAKSYGKGLAGFHEDLSSSVQQHFISEVQKYFRPELFNRIDQVVAFSSLDEDIMSLIIDREIQKFTQRQGIKHRKLELDITQKAKDLLCKHGYNPRYGARQLQRTLRKDFVIPLAKKLNLYDKKTDLYAKVDTSKKHIQIEVKAPQVQVEKQNLTPIYLATDLRRESQALEESEYYTSLQNKWDLLERKKRKQGDNFWKKERRVREYQKISEILIKGQQLIKNISDYESNILLSYLQSQPNVEQCAGEGQKYKEQLFQFKIQLYSNLATEDNECLIGVYGGESHLLSIKNLYETIALKYQFKFSAYSVWLRQEFYQKVEGLHTQLEVFKKEYKENEGWTAKTRVKKAKKIQELEEVISREAANYYVKAPFAHNIIPQEKQDKLVGIELEIIGPCAYLKFGSEGGIHSWFVKEDEFKYIVSVHKTKFEDFTTPNFVHRRQTEEKVRRKYGSIPLFIDKLYDSSNEKDYVEVLDKNLSITFSKLLNDIIFNERD
ncbi:AAA family ATPase [Candidatus Uabimicrobium sp. HlEnr_7]|uniref:AAA family ATPase n=1 Tax=Candidatus Uabimicrobium helgolandensis TaxID=3095367 RepID=UPI0035576C92